MLKIYWAHHFHYSLRFAITNVCDNPFGSTWFVVFFDTRWMTFWKLALMKIFLKLLCTTQNGKEEQKIESRNPWKYVDKLEPIYETHNVTKEEVATLVCRATHEIAPRDTNVSENEHAV